MMEFAERSFDSGKTFGKKPLQSHQLDLFADWDTMKEVTEGKSQLGPFFF